MKYVPKVEDVDAIQVKFGKGGLPEWLNGAGLTLMKGETAVPISDSDYLCHQNGVVEVMTAQDFEERFKRTRATRAKKGV